jgi:hypothetical protein
MEDQIKSDNDSGRGKPRKSLDRRSSRQDDDIEFTDPFQDLPQDILEVLDDFETKAQDLVEDFGIKLSDLFSGGKLGGTQVKRKRNPIQKGSREYLKLWLDDNKQNPYPSEEQKLEMERKTGLTRLQLDNWMVNGRKRYLSSKKTPPSVRGKLELKSLLETKFLENNDDTEEEDDPSEDLEPNQH